MRAASLLMVALAAIAAAQPANAFGQAASRQVMILSPEPGERVSVHEVLVAFSFEGAAIKLEVDGSDVTAQTQISGAVATWTPAEPLAKGPHRIVVTELDAGGAPLGQSSWTFTATPLTDAQLARMKASGDAPVVTPGAAWLPHGTLIISGNTSSASGAGVGLRRQEDFQPNMWLNAGAALGKDWRYTTHIHVSGDESPSQQPVNQYRFDLRGPFLRLSLGDVHPAMQDLILNGQRVRGAQAELRAGPTRLSVVTGESRRAIPALVNTADGTVLQTGTFGQRLFAVRPAVGSGERFQAGLTVLRVRDDISSIQDVRIPTSSLEALRSANAPPKDNLVAGFDLTLRLAKGRILTQYANGISFLANDIADGPLTRAGLDSLTDAAGITRLDINPQDYKSYFILNSSVIPFDPRELTNVAHQVRTSIRLGSHMLGVEWHSIGGSYHTLGYSALQRDRRGIRVHDSFTLLNDALVASVGYDRDRDNLDQSKTATTTASGAFGNLSWQKSRDAVLLTVSARLGSRNNGLNTGQPYAVDESHQALLAGVAFPIGTLAGLRTRLNVNASLIERSDPANATAESRDIFYLGGVQAETAERTTDFSFAYGINRSDFSTAGTTDFRRAVFSARHQFAARIAGLLDATHTAASTGSTSTFALDYNRLELIGGGEFEVLTATLLSLNAGVISYTDKLNVSMDTRETVARLSLRRAF